MKKIFHSITKFIQMYLFNYKTIFGQRSNIRGFLKIVNRGSILIGNDVFINSGRNMNFVGCLDRTTLVAEGGNISIGDNCKISNCTLYSRSNIKIEKNVMIGAGTRIYDSDFHSLEFSKRIKNSDIGISRDVLISKNVFIGSDVIILKGVSIGENSVIAAGSIVSRNIGKYEIWGGNPVNKIGDIN